MNEFKNSLKEDVEKSTISSEKNDKTTELDKNINASITKILYDMYEASDDQQDKIQIMDRMLSLNNLFRNGFDKEIKKLKELENSEKEQ